MKKLWIPLLVCLMLCGCYDSTEIDDLAYVVALGIDKGAEKALKVSFQYAVPLNISGGVDTEGGEGAPLALYSFETDSIQMAVAYADSKMAKITDLAHLKLIVFSEEVAKSGITGYRRDLSETLSVRPDTCLAVSSGSAADCLNAVSSPLELNPSRYYEDFFANVASDYAVKQTALDFFCGKSTFALPFLKHDNTLTNAGMAIFKADKLISQYSSEETLIYNLLKDEFTDLKLETSQGVFQLDSELSPRFKVDVQAVPHITVSLSLSGEPVTGAESLFSDGKTAEKVLISELKQKILLFLQKTQQDNCDILDIASHARKHFLTEEAYANYNWEKKYKDAEFTVDLVFRNTKTRTGGM